MTSFSLVLLLPFCQAVTDNSVTRFRALQYGAHVCDHYGKLSDVSAPAHVYREP